MIPGSLARLVLGLGLSWAAAQEGGERPPLLPKGDRGTATPRPSPAVEWTEGVRVPVRVPVQGPGRELMTTLSFPEESIETAITGWAEAEITAVVKRGLLFLRLARKSEGQLSVIGGSGSHYLLYLRGVETTDPDSYDSYLKILKKEPAARSDPLPRRQSPRPGAAVELLQAMRLGLHPEAVKILRARRELAFESPSLEVRLLYVYDAPSYRGLVFEVKNLTSDRQAVDASRFRGRGTSLVLTAMRENVIPPGAMTRLFALVWKD
jgi:hypothetical protein